MSLTPAEIPLTGLAALLVGFSKTGISGGAVLVVPLLASVFAGKTSMGVMLPMLIFGDVLATAYHGCRGSAAGVLVNVTTPARPCARRR